MSDALHELFACVARFSSLGVSELQNRAERAYDSQLESYYGGGSPQTDRERIEVMTRGEVSR